VLAAYASRRPDSWARWARLAQWSLRATPRSDRGGRSPFELVTGLQPQGPLSTVFAKINDTALAAACYVRDLQPHLKGIRDGVTLQLTSEHEKRMLTHANEPSASRLRVGGRVFLRLPPKGARLDANGDPASSRLLPRARLQLFELAKLVGPKAVILKDPATGTTDLGFS